MQRLGAFNAEGNPNWTSVVLHTVTYSRSGVGFALCTVQNTCLGDSEGIPGEGSASLFPLQE